MKQDFLNSLEIMGKGMLSIFVVILLLMLIIYLLAKLSPKAKKNNED